MALLLLPLAASAAFQCTSSELSKYTCFSNEDGRIGNTLNAKSWEECCGLCAAETGCVSWTHWDETKCNLFKTVSGSHGGNCSSGTGQASGHFPPPPHGPVCKDCPNIIFSLTDDQDLTLGGWLGYGGGDPMKQTKQLLQDDKNGAFLSEWRIHTPICSPSRSETVSGRYFHNIKSSLKVPPEKLQPAAVGHINASKYEHDSFGVHLRAEKGYNVGMFGKSNFNTYEGFDRWFQKAVCGYGGTYEDNESPTFHTKAPSDEYATDLLARKSIEWMKRANVSGSQNEGRPWFIYFAPHCPHTPTIPATKYLSACENVTSPRIPNWNWTNDGYHELVRYQPPITADESILVDDLARRRCQTLLSVDDAHASLVAAVKEVGAWDNTYWVLSSDHGYNLGHHRIMSNKFLLYDHATRIPGLVRGPGIKGGMNGVLGTNVDYAATWLAMAGIDTPGTYDGRSILPMLVPEENEGEVPGAAKGLLQKHRAELAAKPWRTEQFHQYYNQGGPNPWEPGNCPQTPGQFIKCEGWAPDSGGLSFPKFDRDKKCKGQQRPLDDYSNTYIGLHSMDSSIGSGHYKYAEYQYQCSTDQIAAKDCFSNIDMYQLFDLTKDPYELHNVYNQTSQDIRDALAKRLRTYYPCTGTACP